MLKPKEVEMVRTAQKLARIKKNTTDEKIACPFHFIGTYHACRICHAWMGTENLSGMHPCERLNNDLDEVRKRFWRTPNVFSQSID